MDNDLYKELEKLKSAHNVVVNWLSLSAEEFYETYRDNPVSPMGTVGTEKCLDMISGKWKYSILIRLHKKSPKRYGEIKKELMKYGITNYMLTVSLKELEEDKLVIRKVYPEVPPHTEYSVTQKAIELLKIFIQMTEWYTRYRIKELENQIIRDDKSNL